MEEDCKVLSVFDFHDYIQSHFLLCVVLDCHHCKLNPNCNQDIQSCRRWFCARKLSCFLRTMATPSVFCSFALFQCHMLQSNHCTRLSTQTSNNQLKISNQLEKIECAKATFFACLCWFLLTISSILDFSRPTTQTLHF